MRRESCRDSGVTLVETLVAVAILGLAGVAVMAGLMLAVKASDIHRKETTGGAYAKSYAETIQNYVETHQTAFTCSPDYSAATVNFAVPPGYTATVVSVNAIDATGSAATCSANTAQLVTVKVTSGGANKADERLAFVLRRPCSGAQDVAASRCT